MCSRRGAARYTRMVRTDHEDPRHCEEEALKGGKRNVRTTATRLIRSSWSSSDRSWEQEEYGSRARNGCKRRKRTYDEKIPASWLLVVAID